MDTVREDRLSRRRERERVRRASETPERNDASTSRQRGTELGVQLRYS